MSDRRGSNLANSAPIDDANGQSELVAATLPEFAGTDAELIEVYLESSNRTAMLTLIRRHSALVAATARRMTANSEDAEDVFQSTFLILIRSAHKIKKRGSLSSWLYGVCYRVAWQLRREKKKRRESSITSTSKNDTPSLEEIPVDENGYVDPLTQLARQLEFEQLDQELHQLPESTRGVLIDHYIRGQTAKQIADQMELSVSAVEGRLKRGRQMLRSRLARRGVAFSAVVAAANWFQSKVSVAATPSTEYSSHAWAERLCDQLSDEPNWFSFSSKKSIESFVQGELIMKKSTVVKSTLSMCAVGSLTGLLGLMAVAQVGGDKLGTQSAEITALTQAPGPLDTALQGNAVGGNARQNMPQPNDNNEDTSELLVVYELQNIYSEDAVRVVQTMVTSEGIIRVERLSTSNTIIVMADQNSHEKIGEILKVIDKPSPSNLSQQVAVAKNVTDQNNSPVHKQNSAKEDPSEPAKLEPWTATALWEQRGVDRSESIERADELLTEMMPLQIDGIPMSTILDQISARIEFPIVVNELALEKLDLTGNEPVSFNIDEIEVGNALTIILEQFGLTYIVNEEHVLVADLEVTDPKTIRFYDVSGLIDGSIESANMIIRFIESMVDANWDVQGGQHTITLWASVIAVKTNQPTHIQIEKLIAQLRQFPPSSLEFKYPETDTLQQNNPYQSGVSVGGQGGFGGRGQGGFGGGGQGGFGGGGGLGGGAF